VRVRAYAPGRVNLIGDHTDYAGGLAVPMAIDLGTTVIGERTGRRVVLRSRQADEPAEVPLDVAEPASVEPAWARYVAGVVAELRPPAGFVGVVDSAVPIEAGLSSSAALELAVALALGFEGSADDLALLCQRAEQRASGVPCGLMDQLTSARGRVGQALLIDFATLDVGYLPVPDDVEVVVIDSGQKRPLTSSAYAERRSQVDHAAQILGPLRDLPLDEVDRIDDVVVRQRARHVISENERVVLFAASFAAGDLETAGRIMVESHESLREDFEVSTDVLDSLVASAMATKGVYGARLTGGGFGGCIVALCQPGVLAGVGWRVRPSNGAQVDQVG
jgi:galactokinase